MAVQLAHETGVAVINIVHVPQVRCEEDKKNWFWRDIYEVMLEFKHIKNVMVLI